MKLLILTACFIATLAVEAVKQSSIPLSTENHVESRVLQGQPASRGQFPHQVFITAEKQNPNPLYVICGGSLISSRHILTVAQCIYKYKLWQVKLGGVYAYAYEEGEVRMTSYKAYIHPKYDSNSHDNVGIIELPQNVQFSALIRPIRLPRRSEYSNSLENLNVLVSGWGKINEDDLSASSYLNWARMTTISNTKCARFFYTNYIDSTTICTAGNPSTCLSDSGSALIRKDSDGQYTQIGIVNYVLGLGCYVGYPSIYTRTDHYLNWINNITRIPIRP